MCQTITKVDDMGRWVEEIHYPDGRVEILTYMGHTIEETPDMVKALAELVVAKAELMVARG